MDLLRQRLDLLNGQPHKHHVELLELISKDIPNSISLLEEANYTLPFNCHMFSMSIHDNEEIIDLLRAGPHSLMVGSDFMGVLQQKHILSENPDGRLVLYFNEGVLKHSGKLLNDGLVASKWGLDHLYAHGLWEVPASYGDTYKRFTMPDVAKVVSAFKIYSLPFIEKTT